MTYLMVKTGTKTILYSFKRKSIKYLLIKLSYTIKGYEIEVVEE